jgi:hypothetical protein
VSSFTIRLKFHGDLPFFLRGKTDGTTERLLAERTSIKDAVEACGVPHTEVDLILADGRPVGFGYLLEKNEQIDVYPVRFQVTLFPYNRLQALNIETFIADGHLGKLVRHLRLLGIDVAYDRSADDRQLLKAATIEKRALLTRDRRLLMHMIVQHGYYLRSQDPFEQTAEVLRRFDLVSSLAPFSRCLRCNTPLATVEKDEIIDELEPLTKIYYEEFRRCPGCSQIYWPGSHFQKLETRVAQFTRQL